MFARPRLARLLRYLLIAALVVTAGLVSCTHLDAWQRQTIFAPEPSPHRWWREPPDGTEVYDLVLGTGETIRTWYLAHPNPDASTVLYLHGSRWNLNGSVFRMQRWHDMGFSVVAIDYRGFGESSPLLPSEQSATEDAVLALQELARRQPDPGKRFIYGHSLGGAIAINLAVLPKRPAIAGVITEATFTSMRAMLQTLEWGRLPGTGLLVTQRFATVDKMAKLDIPLLVIHGTADRVVPHPMSDELFNAAVQIPEQLKMHVKIDGGSHSGSIRAGQHYDAAVHEFIRRARRHVMMAHGPQDATQRTAKR